MATISESNQTSHLPLAVGFRDIYVMNQQSEQKKQRKPRQFIPEEKKDETYWELRKRNNEAAKRLRERRLLKNMVLKGHILNLTKENHI